MRPLCLGLALALLLAACREQPAPPPPPRPVVVRGEGINVQQALGHVRKLAATPRPTGTPEEARAAAYIQEVLASAGYRVEVRPVPLPGGGESANVVALPKGLDPETDRHLLVGGHYDTVVASPGANDNASGVAVLLEVARNLAARPARLPVMFVAFGAEEGRPGPHQQSIFGSKHYASGLSPEAVRNLAAMINLDMIGHGDALLSTQRINMKRGVHRRMLDLAGRLGVPAREYLTPQVSDSVPFAARGVETGWLWTGVEPSYHSPSDTLEKITPETLDWAGRLTLATLRSFD